MNRFEKTMCGLHLGELVGAEIGALDNPLTSSVIGEVIYIDYAERSVLQKKYQNDPNVHVDRIVETGAIWGRQTLEEGLGGRTVDYVVASHVVEHVPDLITWLDEIHTVLSSGGQLRLIVPDRRFTFDVLRTETSLSDVLAAFVTRARRPQARELLDHLLNAAPVDCTAIWRDSKNVEIYRPIFTVEAAIAVARQVLASDEYYDVHCWAFTPLSFACLMEKLVRAGLVKFKCSGYFDTELNQNEFFVHLCKESNPDVSAESWLAMAAHVHKVFSPGF